MFVIHFGGEVIYIGYINNNIFEVVFRFPKEKILDAMAVVNYLNGGDGHVIEKERWDALDARSNTRQE